MHVWYVLDATCSYTSINGTYMYCGLIFARYLTHWRDYKKLSNIINYVYSIIPSTSASLYTFVTHIDISFQVCIFTKKPFCTSKCFSRLNESNSFPHLQQLPVADRLSSQPIPVPTQRKNFEMIQLRSSGQSSTRASPHVSCAHDSCAPPHMSTTFDS